MKNSTIRLSVAVAFALSLQSYAFAESANLNAVSSANPTNLNTDSAKIQIGGGQNDYFKNADLDSFANPNANQTQTPLILAQNENANQSANSSTNQSTDSAESATDSTDLTAQTTRILTQAYDLGRIERVVKSDADSNTTISIVTSDDIANQNAQNVADALRHTQGVFVQSASGSRGEPTIGIRGYSTTHIGLFVDGIPVHSIYDRQTDWAQFSSFGISEISVSKGYTSPLYGANTLGGSVNIITSKPTDKLEIYTGYNFISNNEHRVKAQIGTNMGLWYLQVGYDFTDRKSLNLSHHFKPTQLQPNTTKINSNYTNHTLRAKVGFEPNENHEYSLNFIYQKGEKGGMIGTSGTSANIWEWPQYDKITLYVLGNSRFNDMIALNTKLYYDSFYNILKVKGAWNGTTIGQTSWAGSSISPDKPYTSTYDDFSLGLIETLDFSFGENIDFKIGVNLKQDNHRNTNERWTNGNNSAFTREKDDLRDISTSIFAEYAQRVNDWFRFALNGSYDRQDVLKAMLSNVNGDKQKAPQGWTLQGILYFDINDYWTIYLNAGKKSKIPTLKDKYSSTWGRRVPNPNLSPESAINSEIGTSFEWESTKVSAAVFYNYLNDMMISISMPDNSCTQGNRCTQLVNAKEGYSYGVEVGFNQGFLDDKISFGANYTYVERKTTSKEGSSYGVDGSRILDYPNHIFNFSFMTTPTKYFDIIAYLNYQSPQWDTDNNGNYVKNGHIWTADLKVNLRPISSVPTFQLSLGAYNLFDKNYYYGSDYYQAGRRILLGVEYRY